MRKAFLKKNDDTFPVEVLEDTIDRGVRYVRARVANSEQEFRLTSPQDTWDLKYVKGDEPVTQAQVESHIGCSILDLFGQRVRLKNGEHVTVLGFVGDVCGGLDCIVQKKEGDIVVNRVHPFQIVPESFKIHALALDLTSLPDDDE